MTHDELKDALSALALGALDPAERDVVETHVRGCAECQAELAVLSRVVDGIGLDAKPVTPPPALKSKVLAGIAGARPAVAPQTKPVVLHDRRPGRAGWVLPLALAACVVIAAAAVFYSVTLRRQVADFARVERVLRAPDLVTAVMKGQASAASATGRAYWSPSSGLLFMAQQLPALPAGRVYQLWTITGNQPTSAGLMTPDANGVASVAVPVAPGSPRPDAFGVTIEPAGGSATPTLPIVMVGASIQ